MRVIKVSEERRRVWAVAMVSDLVDTQGDTISDLEIEDAVARMTTRPGGVAVKVDHKGGGVGQVIAAWPATREICAAFGMRPPNGQSCMLVGLQVDDAATWERVKSGAVGHAVSIAGKYRG